MSKIALAIHCGAGPVSPFLRKNEKAIEIVLKEALETGHAILKKKGSAVNAVEVAIRVLENSPFFNAGKGSAINREGKVQMHASIMSGKDLNAGSVTMLRNVKNPISFAKALMLESKSTTFLGGEPAFEVARQMNMETAPDSYFITDYQLEEFARYKEKELKKNRKINVRSHGTVGAVALDMNGNIAGGTSTGGTRYAPGGRVSDSSIIGMGCYAKNATCAVSCTGDGEEIIRNVLAHSVSNLVEFSKMSLQKACDFLIHEKNKGSKYDLGIISVDQKGKLGIAFNSERMPRGWITDSEEPQVRIYR